MTLTRMPAVGTSHIAAAALLLAAVKALTAQVEIQTGSAPGTADSNIVVVASGAAEMNAAGDGRETAIPPAKLVRRPHLKIADAKKEKELIGVLNARGIIAEDMRVIRRLIARKQQECALQDEKMLKSFDITPGHRYRYDTKNHTVYVSPENAAPSGKEEKVHMQLKNTKMQTAFLRMVETRQQLAGQARLLAEIMREKETEFSSLENTLVKKFSMSRDRDYEYSPDTKTLFELVAQPADDDAAPTAR